MANGFFQPKPNRFLLASQLFRQAPTTHWTGALAQALGGLTAGIGQKRQQADIARQQQAFQQAITGMLPQAQQPTAIPAQPMAQDLSPMGQALSGIEETGGRPDMIPAGQQAQAVGIAPQPTPAGIPAQAQPQQAVAGGINPQVISQLIAGGQPQLAMQLVGQAKATQQQLSDVAGGRAFETEKIKQGQAFEKEMLALRFANEQALLKQKIAGDIRKARMKDQPIIPEVSEKDNLLGGVPIEQLHKTKAGIQSQKRFDLGVKNTLQNVTKELGGLNQKAAQFEQAMKKFKTGAFSETRGIASFVSSESRAAFETMKSIRDKFAIQQREPGTGIMTDKDFEVYSGIVPGPDKQPEFNKKWIELTRKLNKLALDKQKYFDTYERKFRNLQGAETAWQEYLLQNPALTVVNGDVKFNEKRTDWKEYFGLEKKKITQPKVEEALQKDAQSFGLKFE